MNELGILFGKLHSYRDLSLKWLGPFNMEAPEPVRKTKSIPGRDGEIDYSEAVAGRVIFENRKFSTDFELETTSTNDYLKKSSEIVNKLHAKKFKIILDTEPTFYYEGRTTVTPHKRKNERFADFTVEFDVFPYKRKINETIVSKAVAGKLKFCCDNMREPVVPQITVNAEMTITFKETRFTIQPGTHTLDIMFEEGENELLVEGTGNIEISYREGCL